MSNEKQMETWEDLEQLAYFEPVIYTALNLYNQRDDISREEILIHIIFHQSDTISNLQSLIMQYQNMASIRKYELASKGEKNK